MKKIVLSIVAFIFLTIQLKAQVCLNTYAYNTATNPESVTDADFNGDGNIDLVTANSANNTISILLGNGTGSFAAAVNFGVGPYPVSVTSADFNNDGKMDLATTNYSGNNVSILLGTGTGSFAPAVNFAVGTYPISLKGADFDGDGKIDLAVANNNDNNISLLLGTGTGSFVTAVNFGVGTNPRSVIIADFNGDSKIDLATANQNGSNASVLLGTGTGSFATAVHFSAGNSPYSLTSADFNADGNADIAVANRNGNNVSVLLGNGAGSFTGAGNFWAGNNPFSITSADLNNDGKADLAVANRVGYNVSVLLGNGAGSFASPINFGAGTNPVSITTNDFNGDGKPDLAVANYGGNDISVLLNVTPTIIASATSSVVCEGTYITLTGGGVATYTWSGGVSNGVAFVPPTGSTTYTVTGTNTVGCKNSTTKVIIVNALPPVAATTSNTLLCTGETATLTASGATTYTWNTTSISAAISISPTAITDYTVVGTDVNGCVNSTTITQNVTTCTSIEQLSNENQLVNAINLQPNPASTQFTLNNVLVGSVLTMMDVTGKVVFTKTLNNVNETIETQNLANGIYVVQLQNNGAVAHKKLIISK